MHMENKQKDFELYLQTQGDLSILQRTLLLTIFYFDNLQGYYVYYKSNIEKEYSELHSPKEIKEAIDGLIKDGWITKEVKKVIWNDRYSTQIKLFLNII